MSFDRTEYDRRLHACRERMRDRGLDILVESDPCNMNYLTGYDGWSFYVPQAIIVTMEDDQPIWFGRGVDVGGARLTTGLSEENIVIYPDDYIHSTEKHPMNFLGDFLRSKGLGAKRIAVENDCYYFTPRCRDALASSLPDANFFDTNLLVNWLRLVKSDAEIGVMNMAAQITERIIETFFEVVEPGVRHCDAAAAIYSAQVAGVEGFGGEYGAAAVMMPKGLGMSAPHLTWSDQAFDANEATFLEVAGVKHRYHCPIARTIQLGTPPNRLLEASKGVAEGLAIALEAARAGNTAEDVETAWRGVISRYGLEKKARVGYSIGIAYPPDWGEHTVSLRPGDSTELQPNMTFHLMTGMWMDDWGIEITEPFRVTDKGGIPFTNLTRELVVKT